MRAFFLAALTALAVSETVLAESHDNTKELAAAQLQQEEHTEHNSADKSSLANEQGQSPHDDEHAHDAHEESGHHKVPHDEHEDHAEGAVELNPEQMELAGIRVGIVKKRFINRTIYAPGDIQNNEYETHAVSPRIPSIVLKRHARLGTHVSTGEPLVTLYSPEMAEAQGEFLIAQNEWKRLKQVGSKGVGALRYTSARINYETTKSKLVILGMLDSDIKTLAQSSLSYKFGEYQLTAPRDGMVLSDHFRQGQRVEAGVPLLTLTDSKKLWVEAHVAPDLSLPINNGMRAKVSVGGETFNAQVFQVTHAIDSQTRTRVVRLNINNSDQKLIPGQFADVNFEVPTDEAVVAVPESALMRSVDGDWTIFEEDKSGVFMPREVEIVAEAGMLRIIEGVQAGARILLQGAFFAASELAKGDFDPHNH